MGSIASGSIGSAIVGEEMYYGDSESGFHPSKAKVLKVYEQLKESDPEKASHLGKTIYDLSMLASGMNKRGQAVASLDNYLPMEPL